MSEIQKKYIFNQCICRYNTATHVLNSIFTISFFKKNQLCNWFIASVSTKKKIGLGLSIAFL